MQELWDLTLDNKRLWKEDNEAQSGIERALFTKEELSNPDKIDPTSHKDVFDNPKSYDEA